MTNNIRKSSTQLISFIRPVIVFGVVIASLAVAGCAPLDFVSNSGNYGFTPDPCQNNDPD